MWCASSQEKCIVALMQSVFILGPAHLSIPLDASNSMIYQYLELRLANCCLHLMHTYVCPTDVATEWRWNSSRDKMVHRNIFLFSLFFRQLFVFIYRWRHLNHDTDRKEKNSEIESLLVEFVPFDDSNCRVCVFFFCYLLFYSCLWPFVLLRFLLLCEMRDDSKWIKDLSRHHSDETLSRKLHLSYAIGSCPFMLCLSNEPFSSIYSPTRFEEISIENSRINISTIESGQVCGCVCECGTYTNIFRIEAMGKFIYGT